jgi:polyisoprenyl-teichoic acid--peptidoglycan teichoic acid transferase
MSPVSERAAQVRFRRALSLMAMTLVAPGTAQLVAGNRRIGVIALRTYVGLLAVGLVTVLVLALRPETALWMATSTGLLLMIYLGLTVLAIGWAALFVDAWRIGNPLSYSLGHRRMAVGVNGLLCFGVAGTLLFGAHLVGVQRTFILTTFGDGEATAAHDGRYNVLLMGGDSGAGRWGQRPDSMTVASIDAETGRTVLISLPRNLQNFPFREGSVMDEQFPKGFRCDGCMLNGVSTWAGDHPDLFGDSENPGIDATVMAIEGITGLPINYWAMVNLEGFKELVDAVGGVTLNVRQEIPIGLPTDDFYSHLEPGTRKLNGFETLWFARARDGSDDYSRMARQKCVMSAMLDQVSPQSALTNFEKIAKASSDMVSTDVPASEVDTFLSLALKAKSQKIATVSLVPPMIDTYRPDIDLIHSKVAAAIDAAEGTAQPSKKRKHRPDSSVVSGGSIGSMSEGYAANQATDLAASC